MAKKHTPEQITDAADARTIWNSRPKDADGRPISDRAWRALKLAAMPENVRKTDDAVRKAAKAAKSELLDIRDLLDSTLDIGLPHLTEESITERLNDVFECVATITRKWGITKAKLEALFANE